MALSNQKLLQSSETGKKRVSRKNYRLASEEQYFFFKTVKRVIRPVIWSQGKLVKTIAPSTVIKAKLKCQSANLWNQELINETYVRSHPTPFPIQHYSLLSKPLVESLCGGQGGGIVSLEGKLVKFTTNHER